MSALAEKIDTQVAVQAGALVLGLVAVTGLALGLALPHSFFERWGWVAGPVVWLGCTLFTGRALRLSPGWTALGAGLSGLVALPLVAVGIHWPGTLISVALFALWCGRLAFQRSGW